MTNNNRRTSAIPLGGSSGVPLKQTPFPALIDGKEWTIREGRWPSFVVRYGDERTMQVPLDDSPVGRKLRLHEQAHVAWTPEEADNPYNDYGVDRKTLGAVEDGRIIQMMNYRHRAWANVNETTDILPPASLMRFEADFERLANRLRGNDGDTADPVMATQKTISILEAAQLLASSKGYLENQHFQRFADNNGLFWIAEKVNELHYKHFGERPEPTFTDSINYARELEHEFKEIEQQLEEMQKELEEADLPAPIMPEMWQGDARWGAMAMQTAPLTERLQGNPSKRKRASDTGVVPTYMHRLLSDQRVFGRKRKHRRWQGTVLIDLSGSMSLSVHEVNEILRRWPAVTIATYSGNNANGVLRIVAKNGRKASDDWLGPPSGNNNMVDGPALDWLCTQRGPRVWISDGGVTGIGGQTPGLILDAAKKVNRGKIKRIENVQELLRD